VPCGIAEVTMTSIAREYELRGAAQPMSVDLWQRTSANVSAAFAELFELDEAALDPEELQRCASVATAG